MSALLSAPQVWFGDNLDGKKTYVLIVYFT
jgi:hypothetical protein